MRVTILAYGSRGDVQPYLALALGLARAGHNVRLAAPAMFAELYNTYAADQALLEFFPLPGDPARLMRAASTASPAAALLPYAVRLGLTVAGYLAPIAADLIRAARLACQDADLVVHTLLTAVIGHQLARERGVRDLAALLFPVIAATQSFPNPLFSPWPQWTRWLGHRVRGLAPRYNYLTHREFDRAYWYGHRLAVSLLNRRNPHLLALDEWPFPWPDAILPQAEPERPAPVIYGISQHALPCPPDWSDCSRLTGYWFLGPPPNWQPPSALVDFLAAGPPPVSIGFGSVVPRRSARLAHIATEALERSGQRGVLLSGWGEIKPSLPARHVFAATQVPYEWLFPRMAATVQHGGVNTVAAALRAGVPSIITPFTFDQPFWARQVQALGAGPTPIPPRQLSAPRLAQAILETLADKKIAHRAQALGEKIRAEDGISNAIKIIEKLG